MADAGMDYKAYMVAIMIIIGLGVFFNVVISPFVDSTTPDPSSALYGFAQFVENGYEFDLPILGNMTFSPVSWLWLGISPVTDYVVDTLNTMTYIPDVIALPVVILIILSFIFVIIGLITSIIPFT